MSELLSTSPESGRQLTDAEALTASIDALFDRYPQLIEAMATGPDDTGYEEKLKLQANSRLPDCPLATEFTITRPIHTWAEEDEEWTEFHVYCVTTAEQYSKSVISTDYFVSGDHIIKKRLITRHDEGGEPVQYYEFPQWHALRPSLNPHLEPDERAVMQQGFNDERRGVPLVRDKCIDLVNWVQAASPQYSQ